MKIFGIEFIIRRHRILPPAKTTEETFFEAVERATVAWDKARAEGLAVKPWIDWTAKEIILVEAEPRTYKRT